MDKLEVCKNCKNWSRNYGVDKWEYSDCDNSSLVYIENHGYEGERTLMTHATFGCNQFDAINLHLKLSRL